MVCPDRDGQFVCKLVARFGSKNGKTATRRKNSGSGEDAGQGETIRAHRKGGESRNLLEGLCGETFRGRGASENHGLLFFQELGELELYLGFLKLKNGHIGASLAIEEGDN